MTSEEYTRARLVMAGAIAGCIEDSMDNSVEYRRQIVWEGWKGIYHLSDADLASLWRKLGLDQLSEENDADDRLIEQFVSDHHP